MAKPKLKKPRCHHRKMPRISNYKEYMADSRRRADTGENQRRCVACKKFVWDSFWNTEGE